MLSTIVANTAVPTTSSEYTTADTAKNASFTPTSTALAYGDRIKVTLFVKNQGTMATGYTATNSYDGPTAAAAGDTYVTFTENLFPAYSGGPQGWSSPAGLRIVYQRTGLAMASQIPLPASSAPVITTTSLPAGITGQPYSATLAATGGTGPYTWSISTGSLPSGLTLNSSTGVISGTPASPPGTASFTVQVTDANSSTATQPLSITTGTVSSQQALRAKIPKTRLAGVYMGWGAPNGDNSFGTGQIQWTSASTVRNPNAGPVFLQKTHARARIPQARAGGVFGGYGGLAAGSTSSGDTSFGTGRVAWSSGAPLKNPHQGPPVYAPKGPVKARLPVPLLRGRTYSNPGAPLRNPNAGPAFRQAAFPARSRIIPPQRGRVYVTPAVAVKTLPPSPAPFYPAVQAIRARLPQQPLLRGRTYSNPGAPLRNPSAGPAFRPRNQALRVFPRPVRRGNMAALWGVPGPAPGHPVLPADIPREYPPRAVPQRADSL